MLVSQPPTCQARHQPPAEQEQAEERQRDANERDRRALPGRHPEHHATGDRPEPRAHARGDKPEPLKYHLPGAWSRRIDDEHRLVYIVTETEIIILAARYHY